MILAARNRSAARASNPRVKARVSLDLLLCVALGCARAEPPAPKSDVPAVSDIDAPALAMHRVEHAEGGMHLHLVDVPHQIHAWDVGGVIIQHVPLGEHALRIVVRAGEGESLASFRRDHPRGKYSRVRETSVCGGRASRLELQIPEELIECIEYADGRPSSPGWIPATTIVAVQFQSGDLDVVATWEISTELRDRYRAQEEQFFASFQCDAPARRPGA